LAGGHYVAYVKSRKPIEHVKKFFKNASEFDASSIGDFEKYEDIIKKFGKEESEYDEKVEKKVARESLDEGKWYYCSDSHVSSVSADQVLKTQAFLLFYERIY
jgi:ubiquitin C-terminal hydrolase